MTVAETFAERSLGSTFATMDMFAIHLGQRLGYR
jgi:hypothetical protein